MSGTVLGHDGRLRCRWCAATPELLRYHDAEWGFPVSDDFRLFEKLCLESLQSGLSWRTILARRENFRSAFCAFNFNRIAQFDGSDVERFLNEEGIIRHRGKINAVINNAKCAQELVKAEGSFATYIWRFEPRREDYVEPQTTSTSAASIALSKDLKRRGRSFVGPTTVYAFMQATGLINDHASGCEIRALVEEGRKDFQCPV
ncbi:DNA-3-methyladenine glycosylase I [Agrobacterium sp. SOY23]|uniref:DNA-3-methyladenine glycosylase I n=1 Tax=Agrobacterium sp. SOY23 TaxID=3014555 RepID=UPI0022AF4379|nr:DNA-3-methyladenine glycosylase I [Agrobacterium sp. SOY23]MCZ4431948.1 DNA-3-methyladenine glycosylase I [Agrobacterium sp. SOY23]